MENIIEPQKKSGNTYNTINTTLPFNLTHPEMNLVPYSEIVKICGSWTAADLSWGLFNAFSPEYVERPGNSNSYLFMVRKGKIGIAHWWYHENILGTKKPKCAVVIPCKYDRIEKHSDMFVCHKGGETVFVDLGGNIMR